MSVRVTTSRWGGVWAWATPADTVSNPTMANESQDFMAFLPSFIVELAPS
jgi:hypothetical protein